MSPNPTQTASGSSSASPTKLSAILGAVLAILGAVIIVGVVVYTIKLKRKQKNNDGSYVHSSHGTVVDQGHLASQITPFGSSQGYRGPNFGHRPGQDMRVAIRRADGGWDFELPATPLSAHCTDSPFAARRQKEYEAKSSRDFRKGSFSVDGFDVPPPPAYGQEQGGYLNHMA